MAKIGLFYGSNEGHTEYVADQIKAAFDAYEEDLVAEFNIAHATTDDLSRWDYLILGVPTWNIGKLQDDWDIFFPQMDKLNLDGKKVAIFGLGDQYTYSTTFLDAVGELADKVMEVGGELVGLWSATGYEFVESAALEGEWLMGLGIDEDNQPELTAERIRVWVKQLVQEFGVTLSTHELSSVP